MITLNYFAYGSNMYAAQMKSRCPSAQFIARAKLQGYRLDFTRYSWKRKGGVADIIIDVDNEVWGVLYKITDTKDWERLDKYEGVDNKVYKPIEVTVLNDNQEEIKAITYSVVFKEQGPVTPSQEYMDIILKGAKEHNLPHSYSEKLIT